MRTAFRTKRLAAVVLMAVMGCGGQAGRDGGTDHPGNRITVIEGRLSLRGSEPFPLLFLEAEDGRHYIVHASPLADELANLEGMRVALRGLILPGTTGDLPAFSAREYWLLPLPGGAEPIVGRIVVSGEECRIETPEGDILTISGDLTAVLIQFEGDKVWIIGDIKDGAARPKVIQVTGYGVIKRSS